MLRSACCRSGCCNAPLNPRTALQRPLQRRFARRADLLRIEPGFAEPAFDDGQVRILREPVERHPDPEALGQRNPLLDRVARMQFAVLRARHVRVVARLLGHQMAAIRRRVHEHVRQIARDGAVEHCLELLVTGLAGLERQVVAEHDVPLGPRTHQLDDRRQVAQPLLADLDQPQPVRRERVQARFHDRRLPGAARAGQQHVIGREPAHELPRVPFDDRHLTLDVPQRIERYQRGRRDRFERRRARPAVETAPAERDSRVEIDGRRPAGARECLERGRDPFELMRERRTVDGCVRVRQRGHQVLHVAVAAHCRTPCDALAWNGNRCAIATPTSATPPPIT